LLKSEFAAQTGMNLPAMDPLSACWEREEKKKSNVLWEVQIAGAMIELLFGSGGLLLDADTDT
jgi:hypothetical protein